MTHNRKYRELKTHLKPQQNSHGKFSHAKFSKKHKNECSENVWCLGYLHRRTSSKEKSYNFLEATNLTRNTLPHPFQPIPSVQEHSIRFNSI